MKKRVSVIKFSFLVLILIVFSSSVFALGAFEVWNATYDGGDWDDAWGVATDLSGNIYVTGYSFDGSQYNYHTIKYNSTGQEQWNSTDNKGTWDSAYGIATDLSGNIFVTGSAWVVAYDYYTIKFNSTGQQQWNATFDGGSWDYAYDVATDSSGNIFVTGWLWNGAASYDYHTIKYNSTGQEQWNASYNGGGSADDLAWGIATDSSGNVYVVGASNTSATHYDFYMIKYNSTGQQQWNATYDGGNEDDAFGVATDSAGNIYVTGNTCDVLCDYYTIKYNSTGQQQWNVTYDGGNNDWAYDVVTDSAGNIYVTGGSSNGVDFDYYTIKYNSTGQEQWSVTYDGGDEDYGYGVAADSSGNIYVTGGRSNGANGDFFTIKYIQKTQYTAPTGSLASLISLDGSIDGSLSGEGNYSSKQNVTFINSSSGQKFFEVEANFDSVDVDLSALIIEISLGKIAINTAGVIGIGSFHTLYLPNTNNNGLYVCPDANLVSAVTITCSNKITFQYADCSIPTTQNGITCSIDGSDYKIANLTGSGAGEGDPIPVPEFGEWALIIAVLGGMLGISIVRKKYSRI